MGLFTKTKQVDENTYEIDLTNDTVASSDSVKFSNINEGAAKKIVALQSGIDLIGNSISTLPVYLYKRDKDGERVKVEDKRNYLLNASPTDTTVAMNLKYNIVKNLILKGNSYIYIKRDRLGSILSLEYINNSTMSIDKVIYTDGTFGYQYKFTNAKGDNIVAKNHEVINIIKDNVDAGSPFGKGVLESGQELINIAKAESKFTYSSLEGVNIKGYLASANKVSEIAKKHLKESWRKFYTGSDKNATPLLEEGLEFRQLNLKPVDVELLQNKEFTIKQIALLLNIPFSYLVDSASSYNNSQEESLRFLKQTLNPYIRLIEENLNKYLLTEIEKKEEYFFEFNTTELLKASVKEQIEYLDKAVKGGLMTISEARRKLNLPYVDGTDILLIPVNMAYIQEGNINVISTSNIDNKTKEGGE